MAFQPPVPVDTPPARLPYPGFPPMDHGKSAEAEWRHSAAPQPSSSPLSDCDSRPATPASRTELVTPPPRYYDLQSELANHPAVLTVPAAPLRQPELPPTQAPTHIPQSAANPPPVQVSYQPVVPLFVPPVKIPNEQMRLPSLSAGPLPLPTLIETQPSPTVLTKPHGQPRQAHENLWPHLTQQNPVPVLTPAQIPAPVQHQNAPLTGPPRTTYDGPRGRSTSAHLPHPPTIYGHPGLQQQAQLRLSYVEPPNAAGHGPRSHSAHSSEDNTAQNHSQPSFTQPQRRRGWLSGGGGVGSNRLRSKSHEPRAGAHSAAWILSADSRADYRVDPLVNCEKVPDLWDDTGNLYVYLSTPQSGRGASFKVHLSVIEQSRVLSSLVQGHESSPATARSRARSFGGRDSLMAADAHRILSSPPLADREWRLHLPVNGNPGPNGSPDIDRMVSLRNLFALLTFRPLVATRNFPSAFAALIQVAGLLHEFEFGFMTGGNNSFGNMVEDSIACCVDQLALADVRYGLEKTLEGIVLGEQLRFWPLYNEAFCHAVGKYSTLRGLKKCSFWDRISSYTLQRLERANIELLSRQKSVNERLEQFEFPSLFAGVGNSTSNPDYRHVRFKAWRASFSDMRSFVLKYYKTQFGNWPPKASSRHNRFSESGLNRLVLKTLYADLCSVYDLLVNRKSLTARAGEDSTVSNMRRAATSLTRPSAPRSSSEASIAALRQMLGEFDTSSPPVLPPIPFDTPKLPTMATVYETYTEMPEKEQNRFNKSLQPNELQLVILKSHNMDAERPDESPFLAAFEAFELREAKRSRSQAELAEMRIGHWLFLYVVLQCLPMLVMDAPALRFDDEVEYFLCQPPQGRPPWVEDAGGVRMAWFQTGGAAGPLVELAEDVLLYSIEGTYQRSHCWLAAKKWSSEAARRSISATGLSLDELVHVQGLEDAAAAPFQPMPVPDTPKRSSIGVSSSSPSLVPNSGLVSGASGYAPATGSAKSSPWVQPSVHDSNSENGVSPGSLSPALLAQQQGQYSPQMIPTQQPQLPTNPPWPQPRENCDQLQQRAQLRHASLGWALDPVYFNDEDLPHPPVPNTRRIASAGNLRSVAAPGNDVSYRQGRSAGSGPDNGQNSLDAYNTDSTFDSILNNIDTDAAKKQKKRNSFLPFK